MTITAGSKIGSYEILSPLGAGGMGEVWRAHDTRINRDVAIKVLPEEVTSNPDRLARFEQEAQAAGALNHPNILTVFEMGTHEGHPYLVTELLEGASLREKLGDTRRDAATGERLSVRKALDLGAQIATGLAAAHEKGIVHRDLKPENIFVTTDGRVKILDFGLAKLTAAPGDESLTNAQTAQRQTSPGTVMGTAGYMAPEQVRGHNADQRADIFACGVVLYEMLSGRRAFDGASSADTMSAILKEDPAELSGEHLHIPLPVERIVRRCLEKEPSQRFQSARDLAFALEAVEGSSSSSGSIAIAAEGTPRRVLAPLLIALLSIVALAIGYFAGNRSTVTAPVSGEPTFTSLTYRPLLIFNAGFAPDQRTVIFSASESGKVPSIYTVSPDYPEPRDAGLPGTHLLEVSSKGEMAVLTDAQHLSHRLFEGTLARVAVGGTTPRAILEKVRQASWSPDGSALAIVRRVNGVDRLEYPIGNVLHTAVGYMSELRFSPAGDRIAFVEHPQEFDDRGPVKVVDLSGQVTTLTKDYWGAEGIAWSPDGKDIIYAASTAGAEYALRSVDLEGNARLVRWDSGGMVILDVAADGNWLVCDYRRVLEIWGRAGAGQPEKNLSWLDYSNTVHFSKDGGALLFTEASSFAGSQYLVCLRSPMDAGVVSLGEGQGVDLSPDGKWALANLLDSGHLVAYPTGAGDAREIKVEGMSNYLDARWFPDGERILICGARGAERARCYIQAIEGGDLTPVTPEGIVENPLVSPDGDRVAVRDDAGQLLIFPVSGGEPIVVPGVGELEGASQWSRDGRAILVFPTNRLPVPVERVEIDTGNRSTVLTIDPADRSGLLAVGSVGVIDENHYAYSVARNRSRLFVVKGLK